MITFKAFINEKIENLFAEDEKAFSSKINIFLRKGSRRWSED